MFSKCWVLPNSLFVQFASSSPFESDWLYMSCIAFRNRYHNHPSVLYRKSVSVKAGSVMRESTLQENADLWPCLRVEAYHTRQLHLCVS